MTETEQERAWDALYDMIVDVMRHFGSDNYRGHGDYFIVDDNLGAKRHKIEVQNLQMLQPHIVGSLKLLLKDFPEWEIVVAVDVPGTEGKWPPMGVTIRSHELVDGLQRAFLPREFGGVKYPGSKPGTGYD